MVRSREDILSGRDEPSLFHRTVPDFGFYAQNLESDLYRPFLDKAWLAEGRERPQWPDGKEFAVCLTHDVDEVSQSDIGQFLRAIPKPFTLRKESIFSARSKIFSRSLKMIRSVLRRGNDPYENFESWLDLEESLDLRSTFFFAVPPTARHESDCPYTLGQKVRFEGTRIPLIELIKEIYTRGFEIGLHPSWYSALDLEEMIHQKELLETALGVEIVSVRQHFLRFDPHKTAIIQAKAGFKYDSSIGFNDNVGFRRGTSYPYVLLDLEKKQALNLIEIPLIAQDGALLLAEKGLRLDGDHALKYIRTLCARVQEVGGVLTLSWHPHLISNPVFWSTYQQALEYLKSMDPWFATVQQIGSWWTSVEHGGLENNEHNDDL